MGTENSSWIVQVHAALERDEANDAPPQLLIWKVPCSMRTNAEQYDPLYWRFGLHHCSQSLHPNDPEGIKIKIARALQLTGHKWDSFCKRVVLEPKEHWKAVYRNSLHANSYTIKEIRCRLALDALFLVVSMQYHVRGVESLGPALQEVIEIWVPDAYSNSIEEAFCLVENQIPMELLERVVGILVTECKNNVGEMREWESEDWQGWNIGAYAWWDCFRVFHIDANETDKFLERRTKNWLQHADSYHGVHNLDSAYRMLCGWESLGATLGKFYPQRYSAIDLEACGVTIKGKAFTCFEDISFEKGCLSVPFVQVYDGTEELFRNLVVHEELTRSDSQPRTAMCYTIFMEGLMRTPEDVVLLEKRGIISVHVGSYDSVVDMWKHVNHNISMPTVTNNFFKMMIDVSNYTKQRRNKYWFEFKMQFCSRPWIPLSYLAATIVTIATLIQTYVAIIGSIGMKPHFAPEH